MASKMNNVDIKLTRFTELRRVFEEEGVEFIGGPQDGPGVRLWKK